MATTPAPLPVSTSQPLTTTISSTTQPPPTTTTSASLPAVRSFFSRISASLSHSFSHRRPWHELTDRSSFARPDSVSDATSRLRKNLSYFRVNYAALLALALALSLLSHPISLIVLLCLLAAWIFLYLFRPADEPLVIFGRTFSDREILGILIVTTIVVVFLTNIGSIMISAILVGLGIVCVHGAFRVPEDLFLDDQELAKAGLLSFLSGAATSAAVAAAPTVPRV